MGRWKTSEDTVFTHQSSIIFAGKKSIFHLYAYLNDDSFNSRHSLHT